MKRNQNVSSIPKSEKPYGTEPASLGLAAYDALWDLADIPDWSEGQTRRWIQSDRLALRGWLNVEENIVPAQTDPEITEEQAEHLNRMLSCYHAALPFGETERHWLYGACQEYTFSIIRRQEVEIVSAGLRRVIYGRDLMRRWWAWRRQTDEFRGQDTLVVACEALRELVKTVAPDLGLPDTYQSQEGRQATIAPHRPRASGRDTTD